MSKIPRGQLLSNLSLGAKFSLLVSGVVLVMGVVSIFFVESRVAHVLRTEHRDRASTIARNLEDACVDLIYTDNKIKTHQLLFNIKNTEPDVEYLFILDAERNVFAHTFGEKGFPRVLLNVNSLPKEIQSSFTYYQFDDDKNIIEELTVSLQQGKAGELHIGVSEEIILQKIKKLRLELVVITSFICLFGICAAFFFVRMISRPLSSLSIASGKFGQGELVPEIPVVVHDEIGRLTTTFNQMMSKIEGSRAEQKKVENALRRSKAEWERTFDAISDIVTLQTPDLRIVKINKSGINALGVSLEKILGQHSYRLFRGVSQPSNDCPMLRTKETLAPHAKEMYYEKLGKMFLVSASPVINTKGELTHLVHVASDITAMKEAEEDRNRLAAVIEQASETVVITDLEGHILYVNPAYEKLTGYSREESLGHKPRILKSGKHDQAFYQDIWATILQGDVWRGRLINKKKDGTLFEEEATISPVKDSDGQIVNFVAVKHDVTREVSLEKQLRQAMKMEAIGTLAGGIAHDFNNILTAMLGYSEIATVKLAADDPVQKDLHQVITAGNRATELVKQILTFSRQGEEDLRPVNVYNIIKEVLKLLTSSLPTTITLKEKIASDCGSVLADPTQIHQVLMNLCTNAKHAIGEGFGTLTVSLSETQVSATEHIEDCPQLPDGVYLDLEISDTGCGMDGLTKSQIFDPFFTTKEKGKGTGLGLAVVHGIIQQHKGDITVSSEQGRGTTFHIYLPAITDGKVLVEQGQHEDLPQGKGERILLVDDEMVVAYVMEQLLDLLGYKVTMFTSSLDALAEYKKDPDGFDLVITDMTMPEMTGIDLTRALHVIQPNLPVILCTGFSEIVHEETAKSFGVCDYIRKPIDKYALSRAIIKALDPSCCQNYRNKLNTHLSK